MMIVIIVKMIYKDADLGKNNLLAFDLQRCPECFKAVRARIKLYCWFVTVYSCCQTQCLPNMLIFNYIVMKVKGTHSYPTLCDPMDYTVHGVLQARILK